MSRAAAEVRDPWMIGNVDLRDVKFTPPPVLDVVGDIDMADVIYTPPPVRGAFPSELVTK